MLLKYNFYSMVWRLESMPFSHRQTNQSHGLPCINLSLSLLRGSWKWKCWTHRARFLIGTCRGGTWEQFMRWKCVYRQGWGWAYRIIKFVNRKGTLLIMLCQWPLPSIDDLYLRTRYNKRKNKSNVSIHDNFVIQPGPPVSCTEAANHMVAGSISGPNFLFLWLVNVGPMVPNL